MTDVDTTSAETKKGSKKSKRRDYLGIYKANRNKTGSVLQLRMHNRGECAFLEMAKQIDDMDSERPYDWENKLVVKLDESDIGKLLSVLNDTWKTSKGTGLELFHENSKGNKRISFAAQSNPQYPGYFLKVSSQEEVEKDGKKEKKTSQIQIPISPDEAELMKIALTEAYRIILGW